jgi:hypothetical protein
VLKAMIDRKSPHSLGLPNATIDRAIEDLEFAGVLTANLVGSQLSDTAKCLLAEAGVEQQSVSSPDVPSELVPETTPR